MARPIEQPPEALEADEGLTETGFYTSELPQGLQDAFAANRHLTNEGGRGDGVSAVQDGELLTVVETLALSIARDMIDDCERRHRRPVTELTMVQLMEGIDERVRGRAVTSGQVLQEIGRLQNVAIYGTRVPRR